MKSNDSFAGVADYIKLGTEAFALLKALYPLLPTQKRDEVETQIHAAEEAFQMSKVALAKEWGYRLHDCTFPPQIMLWKESERAHVCPNPECGHRTTPPTSPSPVPIRGGMMGDSRRRRRG
jgi:hypothetical protein